MERWKCFNSFTRGSIWKGVKKEKD